MKKNLSSFLLMLAFIFSAPASASGSPLPLTEGWQGIAIQRMMPIDPPSRKADQRPVRVNPPQVKQRQSGHINRFMQERGMSPFITGLLAKLVIFAIIFMIVRKVQQAIRQSKNLAQKDKSPFPVRQETRIGGNLDPLAPARTDKRFEFPTELISGKDEKKR